MRDYQESVTTRQTNRICYLCLTEIDLSQSRVVCCNIPVSAKASTGICYNRPPETEINLSRSKTGNRLFFSYPWHVNKLKTNAPEVQYQTGSTRQKNLALDFRSDFLVRCTRKTDTGQSDLYFPLRFAGKTKTIRESKCLFIFYL